ncbi:MAG: RHS repeat domain-containing protein, partial [Candidatus Saccharimonadales bacterium]
GETVSHRRSVGARYFLFEPLGSTAALTDGSQSVTDSYLYKAFGEILTTGGSANAFRYVGKSQYYWDDDIQAAYLRAREYDVLIARFKSFDPLMLDGMFTSPPFAYAANDPVNSTDPSGLIPMAPCCRCSGGKIFFAHTGCQYDPKWMAGTYGVHFTITAAFSPPCCECCEYQQYVCGVVRQRIVSGGVPGKWKDEPRHGQLDAPPNQPPFGQRGAPNPHATYGGCTFTGDDFLGVKGLQVVLNNLNKKNRPKGPWTEQLEILIDVHVTARIHDVCRDVVFLAGTSIFLKCHAIISINPRATGIANFLSVRTLPPPLGKTPNCP